MTLVFRALVLLLIGISAAAFMRPLQAQTDPIFKVGQRLTLTYVGDRVVECNVGEIRGTFIRCEDNKIMWFNTSTTIALTVR
jgi:hypothetical protein